MPAALPSILRLALPVPLPQLFDYRRPAGGEAIVPGMRVLVPFGRGRRVGVVVDVADRSEVPADRLRSALACLDERPTLDAELLASLQWAARYYQHPLGEALETALPATLREARPLPPPGQRALALTAAGHAAQAQPTPRAGTRLRRLLDLLHDGPRTAAELTGSLPGWRESAGVLRARGLIAECFLAESPVPRIAIEGPPQTAEQQAAVGSVATAFGQYRPFLLEGVTGSGKTEVYLELARRALALGRQVLVLVPEIGLTPQTLRRFRERLGVPVAALHSGLADGERMRAWLAAARGEAGVVLGTRSAVFTPLPRAGLIVVDEEHDASYKQQDGFRYHARDLALVRARALGVPVLLGSATPSLETLANVAAGRYVRLRLTARTGAARPPAVRIVDLRRGRLSHGLSGELVAALGDCLGRGEQALVFRNRRGFAPVLLCHDCGWHADCPRCDKPMTLHRRPPHLACHHCGAQQAVPVACPQCASLALQPQGQGTERLEEALLELFPTAEVVRIDRETTRRKDALETLLARMGPEAPGIYVGTQMLAKGHDLPNLTLVGLLGVDEGLFSVDFRAAERLGQLVTQVAGRAGRAGKPGTVLLQTHHPDHPLLQTLLHGGYTALAERLLAERRETELPPYAHLALLRAEASGAGPVEAFLTTAQARIGEPAGVQALGPLPAPMPRRAGLHRGQVLLSARERGALQAVLGDWLTQLRALPEARRVRWSIDVDPIDLY